MKKLILYIILLITFSCNAQNTLNITHCNNCTTTIGANLVFNGDFELGNTGFTNPGYTQNCNPGSSPPTYCICTDPNVKGGQYLQSDHTSGVGKMMYVDAFAAPNVAIWKQTIPGITTTTDYKLEAWINNAALPSYFTSFPNDTSSIQFRINGTIVSTIAVSKLQPNIWIPLNSNWNSGGTSGSISLEIFSMTPFAGGNDFVMDDISMKKLIPVPCSVQTMTTSICKNDSITLISNNSNSYKWYPSNTLSASTGNNVLAKPISNTTYTIIGTSSTGCISEVNLEIKINPLPTILITNNNTICEGESIVLSCNGANTYIWTPSNTLNSSTNSIVTANPPIGVNTYSVNGIDVNGCNSSNSTNITVNANPTLLINSNTSICLGDTLKLINNGNANTYIWSPYINIYSNSLFIPTNSGIYTYTVTGYSNILCNSYKTVDITVFSLPTINIGLDQTICLGNIFNLTASGANLYSWNPPIVNSNLLGTNSYTVTGTDINGCKNTNIKNITVIPSITIVASNNITICEGFSATLSANGGISYIWLPTNENTNIIIVKPLTTTTYTVINSAQYMCIGKDTAYITVYVNPTPTADFAIFPIDPNLEETVNFTDLSLNNIISWEWDLDGIKSNLQNPNNLYPAIGTYNIKLIVTDSNGCIDTIMRSIYIRGDYNFFIPNSFTPNNDNINDTFYPRLLGVLSINYEFMIFDRWGELIFKTNEINIGWDGYYKSQIVKEDVYIWIVKLTNIYNQEYKYKGLVKVIK